MPSLDKILFSISFAGLVFVYGVGVGRWEWFPHTFLDRAFDQAQNQFYEGAKSFLRPRVYDWEGVRIPQPEKTQLGLTAITSSWKTSDGWKVGIKLIDEKGHVVHEWLRDREKIIPSVGKHSRLRRDPTRTDIQGSLLQPNGDVLINLEYVGMARLNACGEVLWTIREGNHHSIAKSEDGSFWVPAVSREPQSESEGFPDGYPGLEEPVWLDRILNVSADGKILDDFTVLDILYKNDLQRYIPKMLGGVMPQSVDVTDDVTHVNDIEALPSSMADEYPMFAAGDLLMSLRNVQLVIVVDPKSKKVKWHASDPFIHQHDPDFIGGGWIGVFDNNPDLTPRGTMSGGSRIVAFQPHTESVEVRFPTELSAPFYTPIRGKWQFLENGNMLLTEESAGRVVEVGPDGQTVWEWAQEPYESSKVASVTDATRYDLQVSDVASWPCSSIDSTHN